MEEKYFVQYQITGIGEEEREISIAMLSAMGVDGFEETETTLIANTIQGNILEVEVEAWLEQHGFPFQKLILENQNWNALWESNFDPVLIDDFVYIKAHFHPSVSGVQHEIAITPKMSFGTGHHATTRQMIGLMRDLPFLGKTVFDFGTGTGVLAIVAEKLGAKRVEAIDNDPWSISNAQENFEANKIQKVVLWESDGLENVGPADIILANINKNIILANLPKLAGLLNPGGYLLLSGLLQADEKDVLDALEKQELVKNKGSVLGDWIALQCIRQMD
jgi:ribosomal protein L11 methyltransferase